MQHNKHTPAGHSGKGIYKKFGIMLLISFVAMFVLMYSMVDKFSNVIPNINQFYIAGLMTMPMLLIELAIMGSMYMNKKLNILLRLTGIIRLSGFYCCIGQPLKTKNFLNQ